jgi:site-specific DNA-methyltransferase (adenine-specific)
MSFELHHGDCLEVLKTLPDCSVDAVVTDPPYFKVKAIDWDRQWDTSCRFIHWLGSIADEWKRVLKPNGSLYCFASSKMSHRVEAMLAERFEVLNHIVWVKTSKGGGGPHKHQCKEAMRAFFPQTERIVFCEHIGADGVAKGESGWVGKCDQLRGFVFEKLRAWLVDEKQKSGLTNKQLLDISSTFHTHYWARSQWALPTEKDYKAFREACGGIAFGRPYEELRQEYEELRQEYEELRQEYEELRRPFSVTRESQYTDVWNFEVVGGYAGKHPCEKPLDLMEHIIGSSTKQNATVLDCFAGSGATGAACLRLGRKFIGIEKDAKHFRSCSARLENELNRPKQLSLFA